MVRPRRSAGPKPRSAVNGYTMKRRSTASTRPNTPAYKRKSAAVASKATSPKTQGSQLGYKSSTLSLAKPLSRLALSSKMSESALQSVILRWNGVKSFSGNGYYWMSNRASAGVRTLPWYMFDLTGISNLIGTAQSQSAASPLLQMRQDTATGSIYFGAASGLIYDGLNTSTQIQVEKAPTSGVGPNPLTKSMLQSASVQANLWGATAKATKYLVQIVKILDEDLIPDHALAVAGTEITLATAKRTDFYQHMIKPFTFNPIATTGGLSARKYKVLKSQTITIESNPTTDGDADPQCVVYKTYLKLNQLIRYEDTAVVIPTDADTNDQADFAMNRGGQNTVQANPKSRIYLVVRSTNYGADASETNVNTPSFDLSVRINHLVPK